MTVIKSILDMGNIRAVQAAVDEHERATMCVNIIRELDQSGALNMSYDELIQQTERSPEELLHMCWSLLHGLGPMLKRYADIFSNNTKPLFVAHEAFMGLERVRGQQVTEQQHVDEFDKYAHIMLGNGWGEKSIEIYLCAVLGHHDTAFDSDMIEIIQQAIDAEMDSARDDLAAHRKEKEAELMMTMQWDITEEDVDTGFVHRIIKHAETCYPIEYRLSREDIISSAGLGIGFSEMMLEDLAAAEAQHRKGIREGSDIFLSVSTVDGLLQEVDRFRIAMKDIIEWRAGQ